MIALTFQPTPESLRELSRLERETPRLFRRAYFDGVARVRNAFRGVMRRQGGRDGVPAFVPRSYITTTYLHPGTKPGGVLADRKRIVIDNLGGDARRVGWVGTLDKWAVKYQTAETYTLSKEMRHWWHKRGVKDVPTTYDRPSRALVAPLHRYIATNFSRYVLEAYEKRVRSLRAKGMALK